MLTGYSRRHEKEKKMTDYFTENEKAKFLHLLEHIKINANLNERYFCNCLICYFMESVGFSKFCTLRLLFKKLHIAALKNFNPVQCQLYKKLAEVFFFSLKEALPAEYFKMLDEAYENESKNYIK